MCFVLYAGTSNPIPRKPFNPDDADVSVQSLSEREEPVRSHFTKPEVQYIGSTSECGCDFGSILYQNGGWPWWDDADAPDPEADERRSRWSLVDLLRSTGEPAVELYGVWDGNFANAPTGHEEITVDAILLRTFRFKEQCLYTVTITPARE